MNNMIMMCHSLNNNILTGLVISLCLNANLLISLTPRMASNFRHLLSCGTIEIKCTATAIYVSRSVLFLYERVAHT